jgi:hypothetical protein
MGWFFWLFVFAFIIAVEGMGTFIGIVGTMLSLALGIFLGLCVLVMLFSGER